MQFSGEKRNALRIFHNLFRTSKISVDFRQTETNKEFIARIPEGDYEVVHPFQIRDKNERIGIGIFQIRWLLREFLL